MAASRNRNDETKACAICERDADAATSPEADDAAYCAHCGNRLAYAPGKAATVLLSAYPLLDQQSMDVFDRVMTLRERIQPPKLVLDFDGVTFLTSAALGKLIELTKESQAAQTKVMLRNVGPMMREIFEVTRLNRLFEIDDSK